MRHLLVELRHTFVHIHHEQHHIRLADSQVDLTVDLALECIFGVHYPSAGIYHAELASAPLRFAVLAVAGCAGGVVYNGTPCACQSVKEGRFPYVGTSHYS